MKCYAERIVVLTHRALYFTCMDGRRYITVLLLSLLLSSTSLATVTQDGALSATTSATDVTQDRAMSATNPTLRLVIGVITPPGGDWENAITAAWNTHLKSSTVRSKTGRRKVDIRLAYIRHNLDFSLAAAKQVNKTLKQTTASIVIGSFSHVVQLVSEDTATPYLVTSDSSPSDATGPHHSTLSMMPPTRTLHQAVHDMVTLSAWEDVAVIYDNPDGLSLVGELMSVDHLTVRGWRVATPLDINVLQRELLDIRQHNIRRLVVVAEPNVLDQLMKIAMRLSMLSHLYTWIYVDLSPYPTDTEVYQHTQVNFTTFALSRVADVGSDDVTAIPKGVDSLLYSLAADALQSVQLTMERVLEQNSSFVCPPTCSAADVVDGVQLMETLRKTTFSGLTGFVQYDSRNTRTNVTLQIMSLDEQGLVKIGRWYESPATAKQRLHMKPGVWSEPARKASSRQLGRGVVKVVTVVDPPFVMYTKDYENKTGNDRFEGFLIELMERIAERMNFKYSLYESPDGNYGSKDANGDWNGMIRELIIGNASLCLGAISITSDRETAIDFTKPFKQKMFNFLMKKPEEAQSIFQFVSPLAPEVWLLIAASLVVVSFLLFVMDRFSPNSNDPLTRFSLQESSWFIYGSLVGGGTEQVPRTPSGRLLVSAWWFFGLILVSSYTANLAAFLTVTKIDAPINSINDLVSQNQIKYGTVRNTYAMSMFKNSKLEVLQKMWISMSELYPDSMVGNTDEGVKKVKDGNYAFIWDVPINKYIAMRECDVMATGEPFDEKGYGIGVPTGAPYRDDVTMVILKFNEEGVIRQLENKWWSAGVCDEFKETSTADNPELSVHNLAGVFLLLAIGIICALVACIIEVVSGIVARRARDRRKEAEHRSHANQTSSTPDVFDPDFSRPRRIGSTNSRNGISAIYESRL